MSLYQEPPAVNPANPAIDARKRPNLNALRHGITAQTTIMTDEDRIKHDEFCSNLMTALAPVGAIETFLASSVAEEAWRLNYARAQSANMVALGHFDGTDHPEVHPEIHTAVTAARTVRDHAKTLELYSLYEARIRRAFEKYSEKLETVQAARHAKHEKDLEEARKFFQLAEINNIPWDPAADGLVFSNDEVARYTDRYYRRQAAAEANFGYKRKQSGPKEVPKAA